MTLKKVDLRNTGQFPELLLDYLDQNQSLTEFYNVYPNIENAQKVIEQRQSFPADKRNTLVQVLEKQYLGSPYMPDFSTLLDPKTFTVTTGHQLNIFAGPLYIIYKIVTTIKLADELKKAYPGYNFVPVYWMATEDHDFEEISTFHLFGQTHTWEGTHRGAVGRLNPRELGTILKYLPGEPLLFTKAYLESNTLADAVRCYMHELFGQDGLVCLDADDADLKRHFLPIIKQELTSPVSERLVSETTSKLSSLGYHTPLHAREINLFYLQDNLRERVVRDGDTFSVLNTALKFTELEILGLADKRPECFSPNVVLRPLYEEVILPNIAYIGGPSEVPYWMQLKGIFDHYEVPFPMLIPRNFAMYVKESQSKRIEKLKIKYDDLFLDEVELRRAFIEKNTDKVLTLSDQKTALQQVIDQVLQKGIAVDKTMEGAVKAEQARILKSFANLEKKIRRAEEKNHASEIDQLLSLKNQLFPKGTAQERHDNFLNFYIDDPTFVRKFFNVFDPLDFRYCILVEE